MFTLLTLQQNYLVRIFSKMIIGCFLLLPQTLDAQDNKSFQQLYHQFRNAAKFDYDFPRENVFLHLDNNAYIEGETLWFKAYVVRSSSLKPSDLSKVLYVELVNSEGQLIERKLLRVDSLGQAHGEFSLEQPIKSGFYEIRAFTREMLNWGNNACYSRVIPIYSKKETHAETLDITFPNSVDMSQYKLEHTNKKRGRNQNKSPYLLSFYPEGGHRISGVMQRVAFQLTDRKGRPVEDSLYVCFPDGQVLTAEKPLHEGMGRFVLPADFPEDGYVKVGEAIFSLPKYSSEKYSLWVESGKEGVGLFLSSTIDQSPLMGLAVVCRDRVCYFDTLTLFKGVTEYFIPLENLYGGVNRIELFDVDGVSHASRLVWKEADSRRLEFKYRQNKTEYAPFEPIVVEMNVADRFGQPVNTVFSLSLRDGGGDLVTNSNCGIYTDLLLSSELRGYVHQPEFYFENDDSFHRTSLDLLLMVQGWKANSFETLCGRDSFALKHPIEDKLTLNGVVYELGKKKKPLPGLHLSLAMYSRLGGALNGRAVTDSMGRFVFQSNVDFTGDFIASFTTRNDIGKKKWSSITIDRWFSPDNRVFNSRELDLLYSVDKKSLQDSPELFEWTDTLPRFIQTELSEAVVIHKNKYRGFTGNRYTYNGGEEGGIRQSDYFYNIALETERAKDNGVDPGYIHEFLCMLDDRNGFHPMGEAQESPQNMAGLEPPPSYQNNTSKLDQNMVNSYAEGTFDSDFHMNEQVAELYFKRGLTAVFLNNSSTYFPLIKEPMLADEVKSVVVMKNGARSRHLVGNVDAKYQYVMVIYEWPDYYRYRSKKGIEKRRIQGYSAPKMFYSPNYRGLDLPSESDCRRTLYWNPTVKTDSAGNASIVIFNNSRENVRLRISASGVTKNGMILDAER